MSSKIGEEINRVRIQLAKLMAKRDAQLAKTLIKCGQPFSHDGPYCGKKTQIRNVILIQTYWYTHPYGCTGGDYWSEGELQFDCPKCGKRNRIGVCNDDEKEKWEALKHLFKKIVTSHDEKNGYRKIDEERNP